MNRPEQEQLARLVETAVAHGGPYDEPELARCIDRIADADLLAVARLAPSRAFLSGLLQALWEDRIWRLDNRELVELAQCIERHWLLFGPDGTVSHEVSSEPVAEMLLERFDEDVGLSKNSWLRLARPGAAHAIEVVCADRTCRYAVGADDRFVALPDSLP